MTIKKLMMGAGAVDGPQVIAPSSNDWDYTFAQNEWPVAGNTLGDHTIGGYIDNIGGDSALGSLITFDGDFEVEFTFTGIQHSAFGVHALTDDDHRATEQYLGAKAMTNSFSWIEAGSNPKDFFIGSTAQSDTHTFATGSVVKIERVSGTITIYDDDVSVHVFGTTYSGAMRVWFGAGGAPFTSDLDNILFTDTDKVQRDGLFNEGTSTGSGFGESVGNGRSMGRRWVATRTGTITSVKISLLSASTSFNATARLYSDDGTSPATALGDVSDTVALNSTGVKTFTFANTSVTKGTSYWIVLTDISGGSGIVEPIFNTGSGMPDNISATGRHDTITSITDSQSHTMAMEVAVDTSDGEPTPDHEVLFQVQSNDTNGSTSFTDESQTGSAVSAVDGAHHDNGQAKFGTTSIYCDGTNDEITIADNINYSMSSDQAFTWEWWMYVNGTPANNTHCAGQGTDTRSTMAWWSRFNGDGTLTVATCNGTTQRNVTCTTNLSNAWHHIAYIHLLGKSYLCIDGSSEGTPSSHTDVVQNVAYPFTFGGGNNSASHVDAWFEGMRLSRTARYDPINGFTPPVARFPSS